MSRSSRRAHGPPGADKPGRACPASYRYRPDALCQRAETWAGAALYVVGGLYGNPCALEEIEGLAAAESQAQGAASLIFNGDFNWFNAEPDAFANINQRVLQHRALQGNVEAELADPQPGIGCGCGYPDTVDTPTVERSNRIQEKLRMAGQHHPQILASLNALPRYLCLLAGGLKILILHGDPQSLAGWGLSREMLADPAHEKQLYAWFEACDADLIACTHTCLPAVWRGTVGGRPRMIVNNGSAGMGNLQGDNRGLITRITQGPVNDQALYSGELDGLRVELLPVAFDVPTWLTQFQRWWPANSPAARSYEARIRHGTTLKAKTRTANTGLVF